MFGPFRWVRALFNRSSRPDSRRFRPGVVFRPQVTHLEDRTVPTPVLTAETIAHTSEQPGSGPGVVRIWRSETGTMLSASYAISGTATQGEDFTYVTPSYLMFSPGAAYVDVTVQVLDDYIYEGVETVVITINPGGGYTVGPANSATINISDNGNDTPGTGLLGE